MKFLLKLSALFLLIFQFTAYAEEATNPADVAQNFFSEMIQGDPHKAVALMDLSGLQMELHQGSGQDASQISNAEVEEKLALMIGEMQKEVAGAGGVASIKTGEVTYSENNNEAHVPVTITLNQELEGKKSDTETITLKKVDGQWKVQLPR